MGMSIEELKSLLDEKVKLYNDRSFIAQDPICIPHLFSIQQDIEIAGLFAAVLAWGNRTSIINSCKKLMNLMDHAPYDFIMNHEETDLKRFLGFAHRTYNTTDVLYFIFFLRHHYKDSLTLENAFVGEANYEGHNVEQALINFRRSFFALEDHPERTKKHIATPERNSACKRINMYLRWMVRKDDAGVDFGIWNKIDPAQLVCPLDVHVARVAHHLGLLPANKADWKNAVELTGLLKEMNPADPVIYDFALFSLGVSGQF